MSTKARMLVAASADEKLEDTLQLLMAAVKPCAIGSKAIHC